MTDIILYEDSPLTDADDYDRWVAGVLVTIGDSSKRIYQHTYNMWADWCHNHKIPPSSLHPQNIMRFLVDQRVTRKTRGAQLSAMRTLVKVVTIYHPELKPVAEIINAAKIPTDNLSTSERKLTALDTEQAYRVLNVWTGDDPISIRNQAIITVAISTGARRAELAVLEWRDIDLEAGTAIVRHGKRDKQRTVAFTGDYALSALEAWQPYSTGVYVFPPLDNQGNMTEDKPMSGDNVYRIVKDTERLSGVKFSPHDLRRTLATELLTTGASIADVQEQLGHSDPSTTLRYAKAASAVERRKRFKTRYGD